MKITLLVIIFSTFIHNVYAQTINLDYFNKKAFSANFDEDDHIWPSTNNSDGLSIISRGKYLINQKNEFLPNFIFPDWSNPYPDYEIHASLILKEGKEIGLCFDFNREQKHGFIFEFNGKQKFRIKKILPDGEITFPGHSSAKKSWKKFSILAREGGENEINILVKDRIVEVYINGFFALETEVERSENNYDCGIYISPSSTAECDFFNILVNENDYNDLVENVLNNGNQENNNTTTADAKAIDIIFDLRKRIEKLETENSDYKYLIEKCREDNVNLDRYIREHLDTDLQKKIESLEIENNRLKAENIELKNENEVLTEFREKQLNDGEDKDLINFLYEELSKEQQKNASLEARIRKLEKE